MIPAMLTILASCLALGMPGQTATNGADTGPDTIVLDQVPGCYGSVFFDHRLHVQMSAIGDGCTHCHHDAAKGAPIQPCRACHEPITAAVTSDVPGLRGAYHRQCLGCHRDWAHANACGYCHMDTASVVGSPERARALLNSLVPRAAAESTYVYRTSHQAMPVVTFHHADHTEVFGISCASCHRGSSCAECHGPGVSRPVVDRVKSCYQCHKESRCVTCHHLGVKDRFDHGACTGWRLRRGHTNLACADCHGSSGMPGKPESGACSTCHGAHTGGVFDHAQTGVVLYGDHALFDCVDCHGGVRDERIVRCSACHADRPVVGVRRVGSDTLRAFTDSVENRR